MAFKLLNTINLFLNIDEIILALKQKLEVMESFHCSSSSFDALNSFKDRRNSSIVLIAEEEQILSPTFKPVKQENSAKDKNIDRKKIQNLFDESVLGLTDDRFNESTFESFFPTSRSTSIIPSFKQSNSFKYYFQILMKISLNYNYFILLY